MKRKGYHKFLRKTLSKKNRRKSGQPKQVFEPRGEKIVRTERGMY